MVYKIRKGLNLPIEGQPTSLIENAPSVKKVALLGRDYEGMRPTMLVKVGDAVKIGQPLFECKKVPGVLYTSPAGGVVAEINRGDKRVFESMVIDVAASEESVSFKSYEKEDLLDIGGELAEETLVKSGLWPSFRTRPFSKAPELKSRPRAIFVTAIDTRPHAPSPEILIEQDPEAFAAGLDVISHLTAGRVFLCTAAGSKLDSRNQKVVKKEFLGPHPAGNPGTHIHLIDPVSNDKTVWHIGHQDVSAIGHLFLKGELSTKKIISLSGPLAKKPRYLSTRPGACLQTLTQDEVRPCESELRVVSGDVLSGRISKGAEAYLGKFHHQISLLEEGTKRELLGWHAPGINKFSVMNVFVSKLIPGKKFKMTTDTNGSPRAMVPVGAYEKLMPLDILPTQLLRALYTGDVESSVALGCLELDEEDLALCTFADPGKVDYGPILRETLNLIEKEG